jgi:DNA-binding transcriptional MerR regulator
MLTIKQISKIAGITPRTLHYYDEIGLLKPSRVGDNGYRYYGEEALLRLQQILFYRELDLPLEKIKKIMESPDFDVMSALQSHREELRKRIVQMERLIKTVDHTIDNLKGKNEMSIKQLFDGFSDEQQAEYEKEAMQMYDPEIVIASNKKWKNYSPGEKKRIGDEGRRVYEDILLAMTKGASSPEAQAGVERWRRHLEYFWVPSDDQLLGLADLYNDDPRFKANFDEIDPHLAEFMRAAIKVYVKNRSGVE